MALASMLAASGCSSLSRPAQYLHCNIRLAIAGSSLQYLKARILGHGNRRLVGVGCAPLQDARLHLEEPSPAALPPPLTSLDFGDEGQPNSVTSAYIHIPFCRRRCHYCDFPIVAIGESTGPGQKHVDSTMADYVDLVCREISSTAKAHQRHALKTVFFGGGTPSLLPPRMLLTIMNCLRSHFGIRDGAEVSIEMDPGTFDATALQLLADIGVTRVSLGVQAFQEHLLKKCGRAHGLQDVYDAVKLLRSSAIENWSLDIISSLPDQTLELWEQTLQEALRAGPSHISVYDLQIEKGTQFDRWFKPGQAPLPTDELSADFYRVASKVLSEAGFEHYEISNYAKPGFYCQHNKVYWLNRPYYAFGLGSASYVDGVRFSRPRRLKEYAAFVDKLDSSAAQDPLSQQSVEDSFLDTVMLSMRLARGLDVQQLLLKYGPLLTVTTLRAVLPYVTSGHVWVLDPSRKVLPVETLAKICDECGDVRATGNDPRDPGSPCSVPDRLAVVGFVRLSDPEGFLFSNEVISAMFAAVGFS